MKKEKVNVKSSLMALLKGREMVCNTFESAIFLLPLNDSFEQPEQSTDCY